MTSTRCELNDAQVTHGVYPFRIESYVLTHDFVARMYELTNRTNAAPMFGRKPGTLRFSGVKGDRHADGRWIVEGSFTHDPNGFAVEMMQPGIKRIRRMCLPHRAELRYIVPRKPRRLRTSKRS
jgi:hypothetical protein